MGFYEFVLEVLKNPAATAIISGLIGAMATSIVAWLNHRNFKSQIELERIRQIFDAALRDHHHRTDLAVKFHFEKGMNLVIYPSIATIVHYSKIYDIVKKHSGRDETMVKELRFAKEEYSKILEAIKDVPEV